MMKAQNIFLDENTGGKGRYFKARILQPGLVKYSFGVCLLEKETIDKFVNDFVGCPVIIGHQDVTNQNADKLSRGNICHVWYDDKDGWFWVDGIIDNQEALNKIDEGYSVSCQYEITEYSNNTDNKLHNGNPYDKVILNGKPEHLAIVETPRYESAMIAVNAIDLTAENEDKPEEWITTKTGQHIPIYKGQTKEQAIKDFIDGARGYSEDGKQSNRSIAAELRGLGTKADLAKELGIKQKDLPEEILFADEWHHKGKQYKQERYYYIDAYKDLKEKGKISKETIEKYDLSDNVIKGISDSWAKIEKKTKANTPESILAPYREKYKEDKNLQEIFDKALSRKKDVGIAAEEIRRFLTGIQIGEDSIERLEKSIKFYSTEEMEKRKKAQNALCSILERAGYKVEPARDPDIRSKNATRYQDVLLNMKSINDNFQEVNIAETITKAINEIKDTDMFKSLFRKKEQEMNKDEMKQIFAECLQEVLIARNEEDEEKEKAAENEDEELEEELEVAKNKKCKNEDVDKREIIRQIMAIAGKEEASEDVKTIAKLAEKLAYDKSEAGTADNGKKAKCEDDEEDKEDKEEAKNKAKNAIDDLKGLFASAGVAKSASKYVSQSDAIELGNQLF